MSKVKYMHTINGRPAFFLENQIYYAHLGSRKVRLADTLKQIREEQRQTKKYRESQGWNDYDDDAYSYVRVLV